MKSTHEEPRIEPKSMKEMHPSWLSTLGRIPGAGLKGRQAPSNVLGTLMHNPAILGDFLEYWVNSKLNLGLSVREQELIILRMAVHFKCKYVWSHHVPVAVEFGITEHELEAVRQIPLSAGFQSREEALLVLTDEMVQTRTLSDETWSRYRPFLNDAEMIGLIHIVSQYALFTLTNNVMRVQLEAGMHRKSPH